VDHFSIVLGLCRSAMQSPSPAIRSHIERLIRALEKEKATEQVASLKKLLNSADELGEIKPSRVVLSRASFSGEVLTPSVMAPVDKETGAPLAEILSLPKNKTKQPTFNLELTKGINSLLDEWNHADDLRRLGVNPALAMMLFGAPGTGKTMLAHYIASQLELPLVVAKLDGLVSSFLGTTARNISNLFTFANRYKCVLLLDEFDAVAKLRDDPHELGEIKRVVNTLLQCLDSRTNLGFTIAITNHDALLDPAVWRRFDIRIEVPKPSVETRLGILRDELGEYFNDETCIRFLAWITEGDGGSEIQKLANFLKRKSAIKRDEFNFLEATKQYIQMSAISNESSVRLAVFEEPEQLARRLSNEKALPFSQEQLAILFQKTQSTMSRWLKK
jgi:SpoVK/Ycf46/Vps4 family AAA+-type ATPase